MPRTHLKPWTVASLMEGSFASRWPDMAVPRRRIDEAVQDVVAVEDDDAGHAHRVVAPEVHEGEMPRSRQGRVLDHSEVDRLREEENSHDPAAPWPGSHSVGATAEMDGACHAVLVEVEVKMRCREPDEGKVSSIITSETNLCQDFLCNLDFF